MKSGWTILPFGEVFDDVSGGNRKIPQSAYLPEGNLPVIDQGKSLVAGYVNELDAACKAHPPVIVFGDHTRCFKYIDFPFAMGADGIKVLKPKVKSDAKYLFYYLRRLNIPDTGYDRHFKYLKRSQITLPPLPEQQRIAAILDKADAMRELRRQSIAKLDTLLKAIFLEMFGDPTRNPMGWATYPLGQISEVQGGLQLTPKRAENPLELPYLRVANVYRDRLLLEDIKFIKVTEEERDRVALQKDDILLVEGHGNREEIGRTAIWDGSIAPCVHQNHLIRIRLNPVIANPIYVNAYLNSQGGRRQLFRFGKTTSGLNTINISNVKSTLILLPPVSLQCQFAELAMRQQRLRNRLTQQSESMNRLFNGLQQRAFSGQLFTEKAAAAAQQELFAD